MLIPLLCPKIRDRIENKGKFTVRQQIKGNQAYGWHGTRRRCAIGDDLNKLNQFCTDPACATCVILTRSFDANFAGKAPGRAFLRFGRAIYTSTVSSKYDRSSSFSKGILKLNFGKSDLAVEPMTINRALGRRTKASFSLERSKGHPIRGK